MRQVMLAAVAAIGLVVGHGTHRAAAQMPQCEPGRSGAAPGQQYGTAGDVAAKQTADAEKYRTAEANSATKACNEISAPAKDKSPSQK
jgi:hypothetical protein